MRPTLFRPFQSTLRVLGHENPLGLPKSGTPPHWPRKMAKRKIRGVEKVIAVTSAKGGCGKSTIAANLSLAFARLGYRAGILDLDIYGPSIPLFFNLSGEPNLSHDNQLLPMTNYGVKTMSLGYLVPEDQAVVWRGPMLMKATSQLLHEVSWGGLDVLVLDLPPGTGDTQLVITEQIILDGSLMVTTPHNVVVRDVVKGINMCNKTNVNILGMVQNMTHFHCPSCGKDADLFGTTDKVERLCKEHKIDYLGGVPLHPYIATHAGDGKPTVVSEPTSERAETFLSIARGIVPKIGLRAP